MSGLVLLGSLSVVINLAGSVPYVRDILRHKTKPERATWWVWLLLNVIALAAQLSEHARWSLLLTIGEIVDVGLIAILSLWFGYGRFGRRDVYAVIFALLGTGLWVLTSQPLIALLILMVIDASGYYLTIRKTWEAPQTETLVSWACTGVAALCGVLAVGALNIGQLTYPLGILFGNWLMVALILYRRPRVANL